jgi:CubicO group peptidase (beta-lactamase class C family)
VVRAKGVPESRHRLADRMKYYDTPGVSVAVVEDGAIAWARGAGVIDRDKEAPITAVTLFHAASISKPVTATATLRLAELGKVSLDEDVNRYLRTWKVPSSEHTKKEKVTLRRILSHTAGVNVGGFIGYASTDPLPTLKQILDGEKPANTPAVRVVAVPGSTVRYSGGGVTIEQLVLTDVTEKSFPALMKQLVLDQAGMRESTFDQPLPVDDAARASTAHDAGGAPLRGRFVVYPEMAAAGLWSTPTDLLAWAVAIAEARAGRSTKLVTQASAQAMLTPVKGPIGLGPIVRGEGRALRFGHVGWGEGFHAELVYFPELGKGAAVMVNGHAGRPLLREILYAIASEYGWPGLGPDEIEPFAIDAKVREAIVGTYEGTADRVVIDARVTADGDKLYLDSMKLGLHSEIVFVSKTSVVAIDSGDELSIEVGKDGAVTALSFAGTSLARRKR